MRVSTLVMTAAVIATVAGVWAMREQIWQPRTDQSTAPPDAVIELKWEDDSRAPNALDACETAFESSLRPDVLESVRRFRQTGATEHLVSLGESLEHLDAALAAIEHGSCRETYALSPYLGSYRRLIATAMAHAARADIGEERYARARRRIERALVVLGELHPPSRANLLILLSNAYIEQARRSDDADRQRELAETALEAHANNPAAHQLRSSACERVNDLSCALEAAQMLQKLQPGIPGQDNRIAQLERQIKVEGDFDDARSNHFVARFEGVAAERAGYAAIDILERAFIRVGDRLDRRPEQPITVVIYTGAQYQQATLAPDWSGGIFDGKIRLREGDLLRETSRLESTLFHEYTHALLRTTVRGSLPTWLHEGLAQAMEPDHSLSTSRQRVANGALLLDLSSLQSSFIAMKSREKVSMAYAQSAVMVDALLSRQGSYGLRQLLDEVDDGKPFDTAFETVFYKSPEAFWQELFSE